MENKCKRCGHTEFYLKEKSPHVGAFCCKCNAWLKWVPSKERGNYSFLLIESEGKSNLEPLFDDDSLEVSDCPF